MYLVERSSPFDPGARPSNSSDARILMCASNASGVMTSSAGLSFSSGLSAAKRENAIARNSVNDGKGFFMTQDSCGGRRLACNSLTKQPRTAASTENLLSFLRRAGGRFLLVVRFYADLFQERLDRLLPPQKFLDRHRDVASIALRVDFAAQFHPGLFVLITL